MLFILKLYFLIMLFLSCRERIFLWIISFVYILNIQILLTKCVTSIFLAHYVLYNCSVFEFLTISWIWTFRIYLIYFINVNFLFITLLYSFCILSLLFKLIPKYFLLQLLVLFDKLSKWGGRTIWITSIINLWDYQWILYLLIQINYFFK